jgi:hypothetical protein
MDFRQTPVYKLLSNERFGVVPKTVSAQRNFAPVRLTEGGCIAKKKRYAWSKGPGDR